MQLNLLPDHYAVCLLECLTPVPTGPGASPLYMLSITMDEISLVCLEDHAPIDALKTETGWRAFRVAGTLDFALTGILARLSGALAEAQVPLFAVSTYRTDYILVKQECLEEAIAAFREKGCIVVEADR